MERLDRPSVRRKLAMDASRILIWARALEIQSFTAAGGDVDSAAVQEVCGRTRAHVFREVLVRLNNRTTPMARLAPPGLDTFTAWLATIAAMLGKMAHQSARRSLASVRDWQLHLVQTIAQPSKGLVREWSVANRTADIYAVWLAVGRAANSKANFMVEIFKSGF